MEEKILDLLYELEYDKNDNVIIELEKYGNEVLKVAFDNGLYSTFIRLITPNTYKLNDKEVTKVVFDPFLSGVLGLINNSYDSKAEAYEATIKEMPKPSELISEYKYCSDLKKFNELLNKKVVCPVKNKLIKLIYNIDFDILNKIQLKDSHSRVLSNSKIKNINDIIEHSDMALIESCIDLYIKNIKVVGTYTPYTIENIKSDSSICTISIDEKSLSDENVKIVDKLISEGLATKKENNIIELSIYCESNDNIGMVNVEMGNIISKFSKQDMLYGSLNSKEFLTQYRPIISLIKKYDELFNMGDIVNKINEFLNLNLVYDIESDVVWECLEYYKKHKECENIKYEDGHKLVK